MSAENTKTISKKGMINLPIHLAFCRLASSILMVFWLIELVDGSVVGNKLEKYQESDGDGCLDVRVRVVVTQFEVVKGEAVNVTDFWIYPHGGQGLGCAGEL